MFLQLYTGHKEVLKSIFGRALEYLMKIFHKKGHTFVFTAGKADRVGKAINDIDHLKTSWYLKLLLVVVTSFR